MKKIKSLLKKLRVLSVGGLLLILVVFQSSCISYSPEEYEAISGNNSAYDNGVLSGSGGFFNILVGVAAIANPAGDNDRNIAQDLIADRFDSEDPLSALEGERADKNNQELPFGL